MKPLLLCLFFSCGVPEALPPNTGTACDRAIECGIFTAAQLADCVACLEHWASQPGVNLPPGTPPIETIACETLAGIATKYKISKCVAENWWSAR